MVIILNNFVIITSMWLVEEKNHESW
jgi:hypothetical protein